MPVKMARDGKPYKNIVILFDEFGKYLEFAIGKPYFAGTNALQELFEAVQGAVNLYALSALFSLS